MNEFANLQIRVQQDDVPKAADSLDRLADAAIRTDDAVSGLGSTAPSTSKAVGGLGESGKKAATGLKGAGDAAGQASAKFNQGATEATKMTSAAGKLGTMSGQLRSNIQNASYQLQDIAVQAQMGTNAFTILGQQGSQLLGIFGPGGAVAGGLLAVGAAIASMTQEVDVGAESVEDFLTRLERMGTVEAGRELRDVAKSSEELATEQERLQTRLDYARQAFESGTFSQKAYSDAQEKIRIEAERLGFVIEDNAVKLKALQNLQSGFRPADMAAIEQLEQRVKLLQIEDPRKRAQAEAVQSLDSGASQAAQDRAAELAGKAYDLKKAEVDARNADRQAERDAKSAERIAEQAVKAEQRKYEALDRQADTWLQKTQYYGQSQLDRVATWQDQELEQLKAFMDAKVLTAEEGQAAYERIMDESLKRQVDAQTAAEAEKKRVADETLRSQQQTASMWLDITSTMFDATTAMLEQSGAENTGFMKTLLAAQKLLAIPSIMVSTETAAMAAMAQESLIGGLISGQAAAQLIRTQGAISAGIVAGTAIAGMFDNGGIIPAGQMGIVGEFGPEFVKGPAVITSRAKTAEMARAGLSGGSGGGTTNVVNNYITVTGNGDQALARAMEQAAEKGTNNALAQVRNDAATNGPIRRTYGV